MKFRRKKRSNFFTRMSRTEKWNGSGAQQAYIAEQIDAIMHPKEGGEQNEEVSPICTVHTASSSGE